ncbi:MAG: hypothetical protein AB7T06_24755 [Kofleriaceae bacterium]
MSEIFTLFVYDINTNTKITELPANGLKFSERLNDNGSISGSLPLGRAGIASLVNPLLDYDGRLVKVYLDRNGIIVWSGHLWTGNYDSETQILEVGGKELGAYFQHRIAAADYSVTTYPAGIDPAQLIAKVYTDAQNAGLAGAGASIGLQIVNNSTGLTPIVPGYPLAQYTKVDQIARDLADIIEPSVGGIDITVRSAWDPNTGIPIDTLTLWTPRAGVQGVSTGIKFDLASVTKFTWPTDAGGMATTLIATGSGNGEAMPVQQANAPGTPVGGLGQTPRLDRVESVTAQSQQQVSLMANGLAQQYGAPVTTPTVIIPTTYPSSPLGSWSVSDDATLQIAAGIDPRLRNGLNQVWRIVQQEIDVPDEGLPTVTLTFNAPPVY